MHTLLVVCTVANVLITLLWCAAPTVDPACDPAKPTYDAKQCRLNTWRALVEIFQSGRAKAIGVANYNSSHLQEIIDAGMPLPAINQIP